jgi:hypothetical protein
MPAQRTPANQTQSAGDKKRHEQTTGLCVGNLHISQDKKTVTNYAQWKTLQDFHNG